MQTASIPDRIVTKSPPFIGTYQKRDGSKRDPNLFCWFNTEDDSRLPHISIDLSATHVEWEEFHVTFPMKKQAAWSDHLESASYRVYFRITREGTIEIRESTNTQHWVLPQNHYNRGYADMDRQALALAKNFYSAVILSI